MDFLNELAARNYMLYIFGWVCLVGAIVTAILTQTTSTQVLGINAFIKPFKFFLSTVIFTWTMTWFLGYLNDSTMIKAYTWTVIITLAFELIYITAKAAIGQLSHFNVSTSQNALMFSLMGVAISIMTLFTLYIGVLFFTGKHAELPPSYLWGIRLGIICFVIFAFQGGMMGAQLSHTVGAVDGGKGLPLLNWSAKYGDLRIAHFAGMHALQILPLAGYYVLSSSRYLMAFAALYFLVCFSVLIQAMMKIPFIKM
ncbi:MAG: hypothetical protein AAF391_09440 [Bacteroidota bacterium]